MLDDIECGLYTPHDGDIDPSLLTNQVAKLARENGATFRFNTEVVNVEVNEHGSGKSRFVVETAEGEKIDSDAVINCAGLWSRKVTDMVANRDEVNKTRRNASPSFCDRAPIRNYRDNS